MELYDLIQAVSVYTPISTAEPMLVEGCRIASEAHRGFQRVTGEPFLNHALEVASILAAWHAPVPLVIVGLLHDIHSPEYSSEYDLDIVAQRLGADIHKRLQDTIQMNSFFRRIEKDFAAATEVTDVNGTGYHMTALLQQEQDVLAVKMADRVHNLRTISSLTPDFQERSARIGFNLLVPLAEKLGMANVKNEIENYSFAIINPTYYQMLQKHYAEMDIQEVHTIAEELQDVLRATIPDCQIHWSPTSLYTLYWRQMEHNRKLGKPIHTEPPPLKLVDAGMFIIVTSDESDCYRILGILHKRYQPVERHFRDYIGGPQENGYRALHTQIKHPSVNLLEIGIRTSIMHLVAEHGITARWWDVPQEFIPQLPKEAKLEGRDIQVHTPTGETRHMPKGATLLDFAYEIHTDLGCRCIGGLVNGEPAQLNQQLKMGDRVELILGGAEVEPTLQSLEYVKTAKASNSIRQWFSLNRRPEMLELGRKLLEKQLQFAGLDIGDGQLRQILTQLALKEHFLNWEDLLVSIAVRCHKVQKIVAQLRSIIVPNSTHTFTHLVGVHALSPKEDALMKHFAKCCNPMPSDDIIGRLDIHRKEQVLLIHKRGCIQIKGIKDIVVVPIKWDEPTESNYIVIVEALDRKGLAADLTRTITLLESFIQDMRAYRRPDGVMAEAQIVLGKTTATQRIRIQEELMKVPYVTHVELFLSSQLPSVAQPLIAHKPAYKPNPYGPKLALGPRFYGREMECQRITALLETQAQNTVILLWGQKRIGKSSLLLHLKEHAGEDFVPVFVDMQNVSDSTTIHFLRHLMLRIRDVLNENFPERANDINVPRLKNLCKDPLVLFDSFLTFVQKRLRGHQVALILDEFQCLWSLEESEVTRAAILNHLRSNSQHGRGMHLILSGGGLLSQLIKQPGTTSLLNTAYDVKLDCLELEAASQLIREGLSSVGTVTEEAVQYLLTITAGHPFYLQLLCWRLYDLAQESKAAITIETTMNLVQEWLSKTDSSRFQHLWEARTSASTQRNKVILSAIAQLGSDIHEVEYERLVDLVHAQIPEHELVQALEDLTNLGILRHHVIQYSIAVELFACWLRQHWPLELVLKEVSVL